MAPELIIANQKKDRKYSHKVDIWSLGIFAIEMAEGVPPYIDDEADRALFNIVQKESPSISNRWSEDFKDFVKRCLIKSPRQRWSAGALLEHPFLRKAENLKQNWIDEFSKWRSISNRPSVQLDTNALSVSEPEPDNPKQLTIDLPKCLKNDHSLTPTFSDDKSELITTATTTCSDCSNNGKEQALIRLVNEIWELFNTPEDEYLEI